VRACFDSTWEGRKEIRKEGKEVVRGENENEIQNERGRGRGGEALTSFAIPSHIFHHFPSLVRT